MDELEISGKRYISTRRAGKEHKYSSDYIGQLIRGKKVVGQKVGRSWYVEESSLTEYLGKEAKSTSKKKQEKYEETSSVVTVPVAEKAPIAVIAEESRLEVEQIDERKSNSVRHVHIHADTRRATEEERAYRIPVIIKEKKGLVYLSDDEPLFPVVEKKKRYIAEKKIAPSVSVLNEEAVEDVVAGEYENEEMEVTRKPKNNKDVILKSAILIVLGTLVLAGVAGLSIWMSSTTIVGEAMTAQPHFSL